MTTYATADDLAARLSSTYSDFVVLDDDDELDKLLLHASELIDYVTLGAAAAGWDFEADEALESDADTPMRDAITKAVCDQIEFLLEVGPEHDIAGLKGSLVAGRLQVHPVAGVISPRALRGLAGAGLYDAGVAAG